MSFEAVATINLSLFAELPFDCQLDSVTGLQGNDEICNQPDTNWNTTDRIRCFVHELNLAMRSLPLEDLQIWDHMSRTWECDLVEENEDQAIPELLPFDE
ncbi:hypothetical protein K435DRAFT_862614 [Dendrothele bispora CBS 962.96]|uniref:Uncharacterized protein n=1 Tax=Dendrothele bispora (strain CBS 962.96) TaxID=1314807 RepID=A0A4S8LS06_DENBC|nr:hypothetical protein K435DRAFT_862614 [Dendrothele bispora CBS 962.96]